MSTYLARNALRLSLVVAALGAAACSGEGTGPKETRGTPGIELLTTLPADDSIGAALPDLAIQVRGADGRLARGTAVQVQAVTAIPPSCTSPCGDVPTVLFSPDGVAAWAGSVTLTTDANGVARTRAALGAVATQGGFTIHALGYDSAFRVTVRPGAPVAVALAPADTALDLGTGFVLRITANDRLGNPRTDAVSLSTPGSEVTLNGNGVFGRVFGQGVGRGEVVATAGAVTARAFVSVVPDGEIAATEGLATGSPRVVVMSLAGGRRRTFSIPAHTTTQDWHPYGHQLLLLYSEIGQPQRILILDLLTGTTRPVLDAGEQPIAQGLNTPRFSPDGQWIYFSGHTPAATFASIWKVRPDGNGLQQVVGSAGPDQNAEAPDLSPDGVRLVYSGRRTSGDSSWNDLYLVNLTTGIHTPVLHELAVEPRWSTRGAQIAFVGGDGKPYAVRPDGTGRRRLVDAQVRSAGGWSPDDRWVLIGGETQWLLVEDATGGVIPLPPSVTGGLLLPLWNPFTGLEGIR